MIDDFRARRQWFDGKFLVEILPSIEDDPRRSKRFTCPSCGFPTISERGGFEICYLCHWEDDGQDDDQEDLEAVGPNSVTLTESRRQFHRYLVSGRKDPHDTEVEESTRRTVVSAFESLRYEADDTEVTRLWKVVVDGEDILGFEGTGE